MRPFAVVAAGVVVLTALSACGSSGSDAAKQFARQGVARIESQAFAATKGLTAVHVAGHVDAATMKLSLDLSLDSQKNCTGSVTVNGDRVDLRSVHGTLYLKASPATWAKVSTIDRARLQQLDGRWVTGLAAGDVSVYATFCDIAHLIGTYPTQAGKDDRVTGTATAGGHPIVSVKGRFGGAAEPITINVLATTPHYITRLSGSGADLTLSDFEQPVPVTPPSDDDVVHISQP